MRQARPFHRAAALIPILLAACAERPPVTDYPRSFSRALTDTQATPLGMALAPAIHAHSGQSGFFLLPRGSEALDMRLAVVQSATRSLDLQYYSVEDDSTGRELLAGVLRAANRGVRVRLLVDDLSLEDIEDVAEALNHHPLIEIRAFNPPVTKDQPPLSKVANLFSDRDHLTRRMHNKALIADNQLAIMGGRNVGNEYFGARAEYDFRDLDVLVAGPVTQSISRSFDRYWNGAEAYPLTALSDAHGGAAVQAAAQEATDAAAALPGQLRHGDIPLIWAPAELAADDPLKVDEPADDTDSRPANRLRALTAQAESDFFMISPYFVPKDGGVAWLASLTSRGIRVRVLTNSLASTDVVAVHTGYSRYRPALVQNGVQLYEFKPLPGEKPGKTASPSASIYSLHAKVYVVDRKDVMLGSFNFDPRSVHLNTEEALIIHSPALAAQIEAVFEQATSPALSYRVVMDGGKLQWITENNGREMRYDSDPAPGVWRGFLSGFYALLPIENEL